MTTDIFRMHHFLCKKAESLGCIDDNILRAWLKYHYDLSSEETITLYADWKRNYVSALIENTKKRGIGTDDDI